jgi:hypothetical protein
VTIDRPHMDAKAAKEIRVGGEEALTAYQREKNARSINGLPAIEISSSDGHAASGRP